MTRILLVDDDIELCEMLGQFLAAEGFVVESAHDGEAAIHRALSEPFDLMVLDVMMPRRSGLDVLRTLRPRLRVPILMLTARGDDVDCIVGLELGADDYLAKPCNPRVLTARIRALLRRTEFGEDTDAKAATAPPLRQEDVELRLGSRTVLRGGEVLELTSTEFRILQALLQSAGLAVEKTDLSEQALGRKLTRYDRSLDMHVSNLRRKLGPLPNGKERIKTIRGMGYQYITE